MMVKSRQGVVETDIEIRIREFITITAYLDDEVLVLIDVL